MFLFRYNFIIFIYIMNLSWFSNNKINPGLRNNNEYTQLLDENEINDEIHKIKKLEDIDKFNFQNSRINKCLINEVEFNNRKFNSILNKLYLVIGDKNKIVNSSKLDVVNGRKYSLNYLYIKKYNISVFVKDKKNVFREIIHQVLKNDINLRMNVSSLENIKTSNSLRLND
jgi:hypothetical protein